MSDELISRKVIDDATTEFCNQCSCPDMQMFGLFREIISEVPAVDVVPVVRGEWIDYQSKDPSMCRTDGKSVFIQCSECFDMRVRNFATALNYCPNCGADMRRESEVHNG